MELVPCVHCKRHVAVRETACPFCAKPLVTQRPQRAFAGRLTRAAIFSAAVVACDSKKAPAPAPAPATEQAGSATGSGSADDLEKLLDGDATTVDRPPPPPPADAQLDDGGAVAATDAGVAADAGLSPEQQREIAAEKRRVLLERKQRIDQMRQKRLEEQKVRVNTMNKPYGAPPARRRVV